MRDRQTLPLQENRAREVVAGQKTARAPRFVTTANGSRTLDDAALARARRLVGSKGYVTNIAATRAGAGKVIGDYHDLWHVEQPFRMSKTDLRARPMFHRTCDAIAAHLTIVFTALAVAREAQNCSGLAIRNLVRQVRPLRSATVTINGVQQTFPPAVPADKQVVLDAIRKRGWAVGHVEVENGSVRSRRAATGPQRAPELTVGSDDDRAVNAVHP